VLNYGSQSLNTVLVLQKHHERLLLHCVYHCWKPEPCRAQAETCNARLTALA
jgi:hypothetical protein